MTTSEDFFAACQEAVGRSKDNAAALGDQIHDPAHAMVIALERISRNLGELPTEASIGRYRVYTQNLGHLLDGTQHPDAQHALSASTASARTVQELPSLVESARKKVDDAVGALALILTCTINAQNQGLASDVQLGEYIKQHNYNPGDTPL